VKVVDEVWNAVPGQTAAVAVLRGAVAAPVHAYLLVGPHGSGRTAAARAFAGALFASEASDPDASRRHVDLAREGHHPDLVEVEPQGAQLRDVDASVVISELSRSPTEASRRVVVCHRFHTANPTAIGRLLKVVEEPPRTGIVLILAEEVPPELTTIASRCVRVPFGPVPDELVVDHLIGTGVAPDRAAEVAPASLGDLRRAELLAADGRFGARADAWRSVPQRLDGSGSTVTKMVDEIRGLIDEAQGPLDARHDREIGDLAEREERLGTLGSGRADVEARHKRETRRLRGDELRYGLRVLATEYRRALDGPGAGAAAVAIDELRAANEAMVRNPNEALLLQALLFRLPSAEQRG
jgi:DNA polymerase-3 subunit delta'